MNNSEAKEVLLLYRPGTSDREDPEFAEALALAQRDPELAHWFEEHCAFQEALRLKFRQIPVPEGLREQIVSERKVQNSLPLRRKTAVVALALAMAVLLGVGTKFYLRPHEDKTLTGLRNRMANTWRIYPRMDLETNDSAKIKQFLAEKGQGDYVLLPRLEKTATTGCAMLRWQNKPVTMICFNSGRTPGNHDPDLFLFIVAAVDVPGAPRPGVGPILEHSGKYASASWTSEGKTYVLETRGDESALGNYF
jgi:hypothetical protein